MAVTENSIMSHPTGVRGLKLLGYDDGGNHAMSHPTGVRGLKSVVYQFASSQSGRTPLGCVD